jgi:hypothetical protein
MYRFPTIAAVSALAIGLSAVSAPAEAVLVWSSAVGGTATGASYANFDNLALGSAGGTSGGINVSFVPDGQTVTGALSGRYAAPYISNSNGVLFGDPTVSGPDTTRYLSTGKGQVILDLPGQALYFGLLWGSVDNYNTLSFYDGVNLVGSLTGLNVNASANGNQGVNGTFYVNITSTIAFDRVIASSSQYAFEFDNVAYKTVPEPGTLGLFGLALLVGGLSSWRRIRAK